MTKILNTIALLVIAAASIVIAVSLVIIASPA